MATVTVGLAGTADTTNAATYTTTAFTPVVSDLLVVFAEVSGSLLSGGAAGTLSASANSMTFTRVGSITDQAGVGTLYVFISDQLVPSSPVSMTLTLDVSGDNGTGTIISALRVSGMTKVGNAALKQAIASQVAQTSGTTLQVTFGGACQTGNVILAAMVTNQAPSVTPPASHTEVVDTSYATPNQGMEVAYRNSGFTGTTVTWGTNSPGAWSAMALELDTSGGGAALAVSMNAVNVAAYDTFTLVANATGGTAPYSYAFSQTAGTSTSLSGSGNTRTGTGPTVQAGDTLTYHVIVTDNVSATANTNADVTVAPHSYWYRKAGAWVPRHRKRRSSGSWVG